ncbi:MAG: 1-deoxy-D-xylulose-5-phosphate reductoisomerase [Candidatus Cloacimonas sp.]|nr:1-deoxy-D-xylulose-5-phosphate reductoisomerase [Candidatus Cloacimonadota bacterium]
MKKIAVLGITGSIGLSVVEVVRQHSDRFQITFATAHSNQELLFSLAEEFAIDQIVVTSDNKVKQPQGLKSKLYYGTDEAIKLLKESDYDLVINAVSGSAGLIYSYNILNNGQKLALANKESLVMAGHILTKMPGGNQIIPIDSEHSAILQLIDNLPADDIDNLILTASGGPFRELPLDEFASITPERALSHPTWSMGTKISIDSATMFNKGLEVIEAHWLFNTPYDRIKAVIHPQSIVHSLVECRDGSIFAQMGNPSMQLPILYALNYPNHHPSEHHRTKITDLPPLTFSEIESERYPLYQLAVDAGIEGGIYPTVLNAANEAAINLFLQRRVPFTDIFRLTNEALQHYQNIDNPDIETIISTNCLVYNEVLSRYLE